MFIAKVLEHVTFRLAVALEHSGWVAAFFKAVNRAAFAH